MNAVDVIVRLHQHRAWVNRTLLAAAARLSDEQLQATLAIGQGSVWKSLLHLYGAEYVWLETLQGDEDPLLPGDVRGKLTGNQEGSGGLTQLADLARNWTAQEVRFVAYLAALKPEALDDMVYKKTISGQRPGTLRRDVLLHVCTHAHYTAAQVVNMLRQLGAESLPETMLITLARQGATS
jgi:uncharacterized damage-inducible protein DinB